MFGALYVIISTFFTSTTAFLPNYTSGNIKTIQPVSACLVIFKGIWHFFTSVLAFFVHLTFFVHVATLVFTCASERLGWVFCATVFRLAVPASPVNQFFWSL